MLVLRTWGGCAAGRGAGGGGEYMYSGKETCGRRTKDAGNDMSELLQGCPYHARKSVVEDDVTAAGTCVRTAERGEVSRKGW